MAKYYFKKNGSRVYIKTIDFAKGELTFTENVSEAYNGRDGYYATPLRDQIRRGFVEEYPEVEKLECTSSDW